MKKSESKYKAGRKIESIADFSTCESVYYKCHNMTKHRAFLMSMQYRALVNIINNGYLYTAELKDEVKEWMVSNG